ncbi:MAG: AAA family ATPase, partial [Desulfobacteraceae bacterium]
ESAQGLCNTPADYAAFVEKARALRSTEFEVLQRFRDLVKAPKEVRSNFIKFNFKTLMGILEALEISATLRSDIKEMPMRLLDHFEDISRQLKPVIASEEYPLMRTHLNSAKQEISQSPTKKGKVQLDEFLEAELSQEPQVGFIIGVGANDVTGVLLPIATSLTYRGASRNVMVTGAVSSSSSAAAQMDMAVKMTQQSAEEALTMVKNYLQGLDPKVSSARLLGDYLENYTIHHQLLSASYNVGGPSAGYALAINTLSALLLIPVYNDFGITGAPWTKGVKPGEVGGSVIIGGHRKKTEKVLTHLRRMYMPLKNYMDLAPDLLAGYWSKDKDVLGVTHFGELIPEVVWLSSDYEKRLLELIGLRISYKVGKYKGDTLQTDTKQRILHIKDELKREVEQVLRQRLIALRSYLRTPGRDPHLSLEEIFRSRPVRTIELTDSIRGIVKRLRRRKASKAEHSQPNN